MQLLDLQNLKIIKCRKLELVDYYLSCFWMEGGKPMFEFSHSADGAGNSFVPRLKVRGKAELADGWSDVPEGGNSTFRFFTVEVALP